MRGVLQQFLSCRVCWAITVAVFALILVVEAAILVPSARQFERNQRADLASQAQVLVEPLLALSAAAGKPSAVGSVVGGYGVLGLSLYGDDGAQVLAAGDAPFPPSSALDMHAHAFDDAAGGLVAAWRSASLPALRVAVRMDDSAIAPALRAYVWRIAGLVLIIVLFVTAGTMLVVNYAVLRPILRLRESSLRAGADPVAAEHARVPTRRRDEIGQLIEAHNAMLERISESARFIARHDALTGLPNRTALTEYLDGACQAEGATLFLANVVQFRAINAGFGTALGDRVIHALAARLKAHVRPGDLVAHLGADRLALARAGALAPERASELAEVLLRHLGASFEFPGGVSVSPALRLGIAQSGAEARDGRTLLAQADLALARGHGGDEARYQFFSPALAEEARARQALARDLERALQRGALTLALQPRFRLETPGAPALAGAEVLARWHHPERGAVSPAEFIPLAEASGQILALGAHVLDAACALGARWRARHAQAPRLAVNLSAQQFAQADLLERSSEAIRRAGIPPGAIEFEITESAAMRDVQRTAATLAAMRELGVHVSIDDFGTGYSSLNYLRRFAVDAIKIDKSFVDDIGRDRNAEAICDAILRLGQSLGTSVVAEGVESEAQVAFLRQRRCDEVQGDYFGRPVPPEEFERLYLGERVLA